MATWAHRGLLLLVVGFALIFLGETQVHGDIAAIANLADGIADGEIPHKDYWDTNPPLFAYLNVPAIWIGRAFHLPYPYAVYLLMALTIGASLWIAERQLRRMPIGQTSLRRWRLLLWFLLIQFPIYHFAQREHLTVALIVPYLLVLLERLKGGDQAVASRRELIVVGLMAGLGFAIKPYFVLAWVAGEAYLAVSRRSAWPFLRPEAICVGGVLALYLLWLVIDGNFLGAIPRIYHLYASYRMPRLALLTVGFADGGPLALNPYRVLLVATLLVIYVRIKGKESQLTFCANEAFLAVAYGFFAINLIQSKNFDYHFFPFHLFALLSIAASLPVRVGPAVGAAAGLVFIWPHLVLSLRPLFPGGEAGRASLVQRHYPVRQVTDLIERYTRVGDYVAFFDSNPYPIQIALAVTRRKSAMPSPDGWPFYANYGYGELVAPLRGGAPWPIEPFGPGSRFPDWERQYFSLVEKKWLRTKPRLIFLQRHVLDLKHYLTSDSALRAFFSDYRLVAHLTALRPFEVYVRLENGGG